MNPRFPNRVVCLFFAAFLLFGILSAGVHNHDRGDAHHRQGTCAVCLLYSSFSYGLTLDAASVPAPLDIISSELAFLEYVLHFPEGRLTSRRSRGPPSANL